MIGVLLVAACGLLGACGHGSSHLTPSLLGRHTGASGATDLAARPGSSRPSDLVSAVAVAGAEEGAVALKFEVSKRPVAGQPILMTLRLVANQPLDRMEARFLPDDGLAVTQGGDFDPEGHLDAGAVVDHTLTLLPAHEGIYTVIATITTSLAAEAVSRSFVIPIVVSTPASTLTKSSSPAR